jgi:hypothetical protein
MGNSERTTIEGSEQHGRFEMLGGHCHDDYPIPGIDRSEDGIDATGGAEEFRTVSVTGLVDAETLSEALRDHHVAPGVILDLTAAPLVGADAAAVVAAVREATDRDQRLVVVVPNQEKRASLFDHGITALAPLASSHQQATEWLKTIEPGFHGC